MNWLRQRVRPLRLSRAEKTDNGMLADVSIMLNSLVGGRKEESWKLREEEIPDRDKMFLNHYADPNPVLSGIWALAAKWKGSVFKVVYKELLIFSVAFAALSLLYRLVLFNDPAQREMFELICVWANQFGNVIPLAFLMGFYITHVVYRWWDQFMALPFLDKIAIHLCTFLPGQDPLRRNLRRTVMRHVNLSTVLVYRLMSTPVKLRFPDYDSLIDAKLLLPHEKKKLEHFDALNHYEATAMPVVWATTLLRQARTSGQIKLDAPFYAQIVNSFDYVLDCNRHLLTYGWASLPLVYTQVVAISVLFYFVSALFGRQYLVPREDTQDTVLFPNLNISYSSLTPYDSFTPDFFVPVFTLVELISYMGWINVADQLLNPWGDDDEDFNINYLIDRNLSVCYRIVDEAEMGIDMVHDPVQGVVHVEEDVVAAPAVKDNESGKVDSGPL